LEQGREEATGGGGSSVCSETRPRDGRQQGEVMVLLIGAGQWPQGHQKRSRSKRDLKGSWRREGDVSRRRGDGARV